MSPLMLPFTPRFIALTLATLATVGFGIAWAADPPGCHAAGNSLVAVAV